jgi:pantoate--beta-alanine ligase
MERIHEIEVMSDKAAELHRDGKTIGFAPTMGALHEGHLSLMRRARKECDVVVASVYVNPTQFGPNEDFSAYPRTLDADCELAESAGVDIVFAPRDSAMYGPGFATYVVQEKYTEPLCGKFRPGHFRGVTTIVT